MIYLIGGAPRVGKSIIAKILADSLSISVVSTDDICGNVMKGLAKEDQMIRFPIPNFSGIAAENILSSEQRLELHKISAHSLDSEISRLIFETIAKNDSLVIEGVDILPEFAQKILSEYGPNKFKVMFIGSCDVSLVINGITKNDSAENWMKDSDYAVIRQVAEYVVVFSKYISRETERFSLFYQERTQEFELDVKLALERLTG